MPEPDHVEGNVTSWNDQAPDYAVAAVSQWAGDPRWGIWGVPESDLSLLPARLDGARCLEIGCGTAYVSAWLARRGGSVVGIDPTPNQLATAQRMQAEHNLHFPLVRGIGERLPFADGVFDYAVSEYGAALWADPERWLPEAARVLKPGAMMMFLSNSPLAITCMGDGEDGRLGRELLRPYFDLRVTHWSDAPLETEFHLPHGALIDLLRRCGFAVERLAEIQAPAGASTTYSWADPEWARDFPSEDAWIVRREG